MGRTMGRTTQPATVLLVEDEVLILSLVAESLSDHGFAVHEATSAAAALRYMDGGGPVDVLFTDVNLAGGMDGAELAAYVRALRPEVPVVYASGRYGKFDLGGLVPRSVFVEKPYDPDEVCTLLARLTAARH